VGSDPGVTVRGRGRAGSVPPGLVAHAPVAYGEVKIFMPPGSEYGYGEAYARGSDDPDAGVIAGATNAVGTCVFHEATSTAVPTATT
jgi:hypothetical protein